MNHTSRVRRLGLATALVGVVAGAGCRSDSTGPDPDPPFTYSPDGQGCRVEFWRQEANLHRWPEEWAPDRTAGRHFPGMTFIDVIWLEGDGLNALGRETVAAVLNAAHEDVDYGLRPEQVTGAYYEAADAGNYDRLWKVLKDLNRRTCPLS